MEDEPQRKWTPVPQPGHADSDRLPRRVDAACPPNGGPETLGKTRTRESERALSRRLAPSRLTILKITLRAYRNGEDLIAEFEQYVKSKLPPHHSAA